MGIVDQNGIVLSRSGNDLHAPLDAARVTKRRRQLRKRNAERQTRSENRQRIIDAECARNAQLRAADLKPGHNIGLHAVCIQTDVLGNKVCGVVLCGIGQDLTRRLTADAITVQVVQIHDAGVTMAEQNRLRVAVIEHRLVEIQMILGQICEHAHLEADTLHAAERQRM